MVFEIFLTPLAYVEPAPIENLLINYSPDHSSVLSLNYNFSCFLAHCALVCYVGLRLFDIGINYSS